MGKLVTPAVYHRFPEHDVFFSYFKVFRDLLCSCEPHEINKSRTVSEMGNDAFLACSHAEFFEICELTHYLNERHVTAQLVDAIDFRAVNIFIRIIFQQVTECLDAQFFFQQFLAMRSNARNIHYVLPEYVSHGVVLSLKIATLELSCSAGYTFPCVCCCAAITSAMHISKGVVIFMFSRFPSTSVMSCPSDSTTEASSVKPSL